MATAYKGPKRIDYPQFTITTLNEMHQFDLLYMPHDKLYGNTYKYILTGIDVASRYKVARPLRTKRASEVADKIKDVCKAGPLHYPKTLQSDNGSKFKSDVTKLLEDKGVEIRRVTTNTTTHLKPLWKATTGSLQNDYSSPRMPKMKGINNIKTAMIAMKPNKAIKLDEVSLTKSEEYPEEKPLPGDGLYLNLLQPGEEHGDSRRRATDAWWSRKMYRLDHMVKGSRTIYYLKDGPERSYVLEELMLIPEVVEVPPEHVKEW
ncbi:uncharacterized protein LOC130612841 [Hydractinia symbiolongicarpus]|uniref:uncharacterized protein LOC130612841 n=1 Tax=Hydractinia symbiolongicarpus TaxID=13093 RepID=UPI00254B7614|nr:uncharacterized protein LOC130612841 [Hydractinia symbiolongicarpus]